MPDPSASKWPRLREPTVADGARIWQLVQASGVLDENSCYLYVLLARDFAATCVVAEAGEGEVVGFVSAYRRPQHPDTLFVWQVGVAESARRQGLARHMLDHLLAREAGRGLRYLEATVSESNRASRRLFQSLARDHAVPIELRAGFAADLFGPAGHEPEPLLRIGPFPAAA